MLVAAWVVIWETVYDFLFKGSGRKIKSKMYKSLINAIVEFEQLKTRKFKILLDFIILYF